MNELMIFENPEFGIVNVMEINGDVYFEVYSVGMALGQTKESKGKLYPRKERIDENIKNAEIKPVVHNGQLWITESQLYDLMLETHTEKVKPFKKWVTNEVLPSIRKNGGYISGQETMSDDELLAKALMVAQKKIAEKNQAINQLKTEVDVKNQMIGELKPKAEFFDAVADSKDAIEIGKVAKVLNYPGIGRNKLFEILRQNGILMRNNIPYQKYIDNGCFRTVEQKYSMPDGETRISIKTLVYQKGVEHIRRVLKS